MSVQQEKSARFDEIRKLLLDLNDCNILDTLNSIGEIVNRKFGTQDPSRDGASADIQLVEDLSDPSKKGKMFVVIRYFLDMFETGGLDRYPERDVVQKMFNLNPNSGIASNVRRMLKYDFEMFDQDWKLKNKALWNNNAIRTWKEKHPED